MCACSYQNCSGQKYLSTYKINKLQYGKCFVRCRLRTRFRLQAVPFWIVERSREIAEHQKKLERTSGRRRKKGKRKRKGLRS